MVFLFIKTYSSVNQLSLNYNKLGDNEKNMMYLSEGLKINTSIEKLNLGHNKLG